MASSILGIVDMVVGEGKTYDGGKMVQALFLCSISG